MRRWLVGTLLLVAAGRVVLADASQPRVDAAPVALDNRQPERESVGELDYLAGFSLSAEATEWGGLSGIALAADGSSLMAVSDIGFWYRLKLAHDGSGRLIDIQIAERGRLLDEAGQPLKGKNSADAEALAVKSDGSLYVAFENRHRLWRYGPAANPFLGKARYTQPPKGMTGLPRNFGIEAAAFLAQDRMLLLSEDGRRANGDLIGWYFDGSHWTEVGLIPTGSFQPTDLTLLPDGDLLLLERSFNLLDGPAARLSVIPAATIASGARLAGREIAVIRRPLTVDNFEAVAARRGADGATLIYILSDDNLNALQRTLLLQFRLRP